MDIAHFLEARSPDSDGSGCVEHQIAVGDCSLHHIRISNIASRAIERFYSLVKPTRLERQAKNANVGRQRKQLLNDLPAEKAGAARHTNSLVFPVISIGKHGV